MNKSTTRTPAIPDRAAATGAAETRPWGAFLTIEEGPGYKVKRLTVEPGKRLSLQRHHHRAEHWVVIEGVARVVVAGRVRRLGPRKSVDVPRKAWHRIENPGAARLVIIEVQHGPYLGEDDIERRQDDFGRVDAATGRGASRARARR